MNLKERLMKRLGLYTDIAAACDIEWINMDDPMQRIQSVRAALELLKINADAEFIKHCTGICDEQTLWHYKAQAYGIAESLKLIDKLPEIIRIQESKLNKMDV